MASPSTSTLPFLHYVMKRTLLSTPNTITTLRFWRQPYYAIRQEVDNCLYVFFKRMRSLFERRGISNLLPFQHKLMTPTWIIANTDKNLDPCVIELNQCTKDDLVHLHNSEIYEFLTEEKLWLKPTVCQEKSWNGYYSRVREKEP